MTMTEWFDTLDGILLERLGVDSGSLADQPYSLTDRYHAGEHPEDVADDILADPMEYL